LSIVNAVTKIDSPGTCSDLTRTVRKSPLNQRSAIGEPLKRAAIADIGSLRFGFLGASLVLDANEPNTCSFERAGLASEFSIKPWRSLPVSGSKSSIVKSL
jgi:hypothetical protein